MFEKTKAKVHASIEKVKKVDKKEMVVKAVKASLPTMVATVVAGQLAYKHGYNKGGYNLVRGITAYYQEYPEETVNAMNSWVESDIYETHNLSDKEKQYMQDHIDKIYAD